MEKRRKLNLYCVDTVGGGGTEVWVRSLIKTLASYYEVRLISGSLDSELKEFVSRFVKVPLPSKPAFCRVLVYSLFSTAIPKLGAEVVQTVGAITFRKSDVNTIHFYHRENFRLRDTTIYRNKSKIRIFNRLIYTVICIIMEKIIYTSNFSKKIASVSPEMCSLIEQDFSRSVSLTHNGIDPSEIEVKSLQSFEPYLLFVGGDWERKGLSDVIQSVGIIKDSFPLIKLYIVGMGNAHNFSKNVEGLQVGQNIVWMGRLPRNQIPYHPTSILVCASNFEVSPLIFLEAAMAGTPVISYPVFGTLEAVQDGYLMVSEPSPEGIAAKVVELLSDEQKMIEMSKAGLQLRETKNWAITVMETLALYPGRND